MRDTSEKKSVFDHSGYLEFIRERFGSSQKRTGLRMKAAQAMGCQPSFLSQVLAGKQHLSLEQAVDLGRFLAMDEHELRFFTLLVSRARAGTQQLRKLIDADIKREARNRLNLVERLGRERELSDQEKLRYYSSWLYPAVHMAVTIPGLQTREALKKHFAGQPSKLVEDVIDFLVRSGLLTEKKGSLSTGVKSVRLSKDSPFIVNHHANWRLRAIESLPAEDELDLHYSGAVTLSEEDAMVLKDKMLKVLKEHIDLIRESPAEKLYVYNLDFFKI